jgi:hypothetical protein
MFDKSALFYKTNPISPISRLKTTIPLKNKPSSNPNKLNTGPKVGGQTQFKAKKTQFQTALQALTLIYPIAILDSLIVFYMYSHVKIGKRII